MRYTFFKKTLCLLLVFFTIFVFNSCNSSNKDVNIQDYSEDYIVKFKIESPANHLIFIYTAEHKIITYDEAEDKTVIADVMEHKQRLISLCLDNIYDKEATDIEFYGGADDGNEATLYYNGNEYSFTYGVSKEPYVNILLEIIIGSSNYEPAEDLVPFNMIFRE